jgi:CheY-like chemotaxis protein
MVSHELRTPLTAVIGYTDLLLRQVHGSLTERQEQHQRAVSKAAHRLLELINDLLDVTRLESGQVELNLDDVPLGDAFDRALARLQGSAEARGIELRLDVPTNLPSVRADPDRLQQILVNLLDNAIKFTPRGGTVTLRADRRDGAAHVSVSDTGVGVPPEHLERIWDRFHQADSSARRRFGGTGLGLAIVRNLVELHRGRVRAHSRGPGNGSTFCFALPLGEADAPTGERGPSRPEPAASPTAGRRHVLIVDDDVDNRGVIASIVGDLLGHQPVLAEDGQQALALADDRPDLILLDLRLPGLDGFEVARRLKAAERTADIPIVAISALADRDDREAAYAAGCVGWVTKPFTPTGLGDAIDRALAAAERG